MDHAGMHTAHTEAMPIFARSFVSPAPWACDRESGEMPSLAALEMRVDIVQNHLDLLSARANVADLERRAAQSMAAIARCRRCEFGPEMRSLLELKIRALEQDVAVGMDEASSDVFLFFH
jgi:hypothetical protein